MYGLLRDLLAAEDYDDRFDYEYDADVFSKPQQTVAPRTNSEPREKVNVSLIELPSNNSKMLAIVTRFIAIHNLRPTASRKNSKAMITVATISKLLSSDVLAAEQVFKPNIIRMGVAASTAKEIDFLFTDGTITSCFLPLTTKPLLKTQKAADTLLLTEPRRPMFRDF